MRPAVSIQAAVRGFLVRAESKVGCFGHRVSVKELQEERLWHLLFECIELWESSPSSMEDVRRTVTNPTIRWLLRYNRGGVPWNPHLVTMVQDYQRQRLVAIKQLLDRHNAPTEVFLSSCSIDNLGVNFIGSESLPRWNGGRRVVGMIIGGYGDPPWYTRQRLGALRDQLIPSA
jgi:hypothetical protein